MKIQLTLITRSNRLACGDYYISKRIQNNDNFKSKPDCVKLKFRFEDQEDMLNFLLFNKCISFDFALLHIHCKANTN